MLSAWEFCVEEFEESEESTDWRKLGELTFFLFVLQFALNRLGLAGNFILLKPRSAFRLMASRLVVSRLRVDPPCSAALAWYPNENSLLGFVHKNVEKFSENQKKVHARWKPLLNRQGLLGKRFAFSSGQEFRTMSSGARLAKDLFIAKYAEDDALQSQPCFVCEGRNWAVIGEIDRYGFLYPTALCGECGNVQQSRYYGDNILQDFYENFYRKIYGKPEPKKFFERQRRTGSKVWDFVTQLRTPKTVLEVGCGAGGILSVFQDRGSEVLGLDYDEIYLAEARRHEIPVVKGPIETFASENKFDLIILCHVLEHLVNPVQLLKELRGLLTPGGILYIEVPSLEYVSNGGYGYDLLQYFQNAHTIHFTTETLRLLMLRAGFSGVRSTEYIHSCWKTAAPGGISIGDKKTSKSRSERLLIRIEVRRKRRKLLGKLLSLVGLKRPAKSIYLRYKNVRGQLPSI